nr:hypothetical protein B0A51_16627 [Rachicladosporium sp. CCFEE 5018]
MASPPVPYAQILDQAAANASSALQFCTAEGCEAISLPIRWFTLTNFILYYLFMSVVLPGFFPELFLDLFLPLRRNRWNWPWIFGVSITSSLLWAFSIGYADGWKIISFADDMHTGIPFPFSSPIQTSAATAVDAERIIYGCLWHVSKVASMFHLRTVLWGIAFRIWLEWRNPITRAVAMRGQSVPHILVDM